MTTKGQHSLKYWILRIIQWDRKRLLIGILLAAFTAISGVALLMLSGWFITASALTGLALAVGLVIKLDVYLPGSGIRFFALSRTIGRYAERLYNHNAVLSLISYVRHQLFAGLISLPDNQTQQTKNTEWLSRLTADLDSLDNILLQMIIPPAVAIVVTLLIGLFFSIFWPVFALCFTLLLVLLGVSNTLLIIKTGQSDSYKAAQLLNLARGQAIEHLQGQMVLKSMGANQRHQQKLMQTIAQFGILQNRLNRRLQNCQLLHNVLMSACLVFFSVTAFYGYQQDYFSGPVAILIILACVAVIELLQSLPAQFSQWGKISYAAERLQSLAQQSSQMPEDKRNNELIVDHWPDSISELAVSVSQHPYIPSSLDGLIKFNLAPSDKLLILGKSGRGKSTLGELISGQGNCAAFPQTQCSVLINTIKLEQNNITQWQHKIAYLSQHNTVLADTLYANLTLGLCQPNIDQIYAALDAVELGDWVRSLPQQLNTWLGDTGSQLSGGQARRLCLARLMLKSSDFVILDEPFNGVDSDMAARIWANFSCWLADKGLVLLIHEQPSFWPDETHINHRTKTLIL